MIAREFERVDALLRFVQQRNPQLLPPRYSGFVPKDNSFYRPIRDAGLATGKLTPQ